MRIEGARAPQRPEAPDVAQELFFLEDPLGILGERDEELVLLGGELHRLPADRVREARSISRSRTESRGCCGQFDRRRTARIRASSSS
jgi:hypothetical protein